jgi:hypothetical protein
MAVLVPRWIIGFDKSQPELARAKFQFVIQLFLFWGEVSLQIASNMKTEK